MCVCLYNEINIYILLSVKIQNLDTPESTYAEWNLSKKLQWCRREAAVFGEAYMKQSCRPGQEDPK